MKTTEISYSVLQKAVPRPPLDKLGDDNGQALFQQQRLNSPLARQQMHQWLGASMSAVGGRGRGGGCRSLIALKVALGRHPPNSFNSLFNGVCLPQRRAAGVVAELPYKFAKIARKLRVSGGKYRSDQQHWTQAAVTNVRRIARKVGDTCGVGDERSFYAHSQFCKVAFSFTCDVLIGFHLPLLRGLTVWNRVD